MSEAIAKDYIGYEYKDVTVKRDLQPIYMDSYSNFGWTLEDTTTPEHRVGSITIKFKRDRKIRNKAELTRLQRQFDACIEEIQKLEFSKILVASGVAYMIGVLGTAFMAGAVFAYLGNLIALMVLLAIPGFIGWIVPYISYVLIRRKKVAEVTPLIDQKYDEIYEVCEKANGLLS